MFLIRLSICIDFIIIPVTPGLGHSNLHKKSITIGELSGQYYFGQKGQSYCSQRGQSCLAKRVKVAWLFQLDIHRLFVFAILISIVGFHTFAEITETSLLVRLKINSFVLSKMLYATILILGILFMTITNNIGIIGIFICFLFAQLFNCAYLHIIDLRIWSNRYKNKQII